MYTINFHTVDFVLLVIFGLVGYFMKTYKIPTAPMILAVVIGSSLEQSFRQSLMLSDGSLAIFFRSGICLTLLALAAISLVYPYAADWFKIRRRRVGLEGSSG